MRIFEVGGCIRDELMGLPVHDVDFSVEAESFQAMHDELERQGFRIWQVREEFLTIRASVPKGHPLAERTKDADFVMCRKDAATGDGRRPDFVEPGTIFDDLARRDFTVNAIARDVVTGEIFDPHWGRDDLEIRALRFVGDPKQRIREDGLRVLRGFRFMVTKGLCPTPHTRSALHSWIAVEMMRCVSVERIREELVKMFQADTVAALAVLSSLTTDHQRAIFRDGLRLDATLKA